MVKILAISDLHVGNIVSLFPPEFITQDGIKIYQNDIQRQIYNIYKEMCDEVGYVDLTIVDGDFVEGYNPAEHGLGCWSTDIIEQTRCCIQLLKMIHTKEYLCMEGTLFHGGKNPNGDRMVSNGLPNSYWGGGAKIFSIKPFKEATPKDYVTGHVKHKISHASKPSTEVSSNASEIERLIYDYKYYGDVSLSIRAHRHRGSHVQLSGNRHGIVLPCFKWRDLYGKREVTQVPEIGYAIINIEDKDTIDVKLRQFQLQLDDTYSL